MSIELSFLAHRPDLAPKTEIEVDPILTHSQLLSQAWQKLNEALETDGLGGKFRDARADYTQKFLAYWSQKAHQIAPMTPHCDS